MVDCIKLSTLASVVDAQLEGDADFEVRKLASLAAAQSSDLSFVSQERYAKHLDQTKAGALILKREWAASFAGNKLIVADPYLAYAQASELFDKLSRLPQGIHASAVVADSAQLAASVAIGAQCVVGENVKLGENVRLYPGVVLGDNVEIGDDSLIHANVTLYHDVRLGKRCMVHSGTVIGSDGFGFAPAQGRWNKIHQLGAVVIGNDVEIGSNTAIDRGAIEDTLIEDGVIIDNLVHIAHNVQIGAGSAIAGCVGIAGSATVGKRCTVAGAVAINGHITIADNSHFHGGTIVTKGNDEPGVFASAPPLQSVKKWRRNSVRYTQLDELSSRIKALEKQLESKVSDSKP